MVRVLRSLGLVLVAVLAVSAAPTSVAQATPNFHSEVAPVLFEGDQVVPLLFSVELGLTTKCATAHLKGTSTAQTSTTLSLEAQYGTCKTFGLASDIKMNGCTYLFHLVAGSSPPTATMDVSCPGGAKIEIESTFDNCIIKTSPQTGRNHVLFSYTGTGSTRDIDASFIVTGMSYEEVGSECPDPGAHTDGEYTGTATLKGYKDEPIKGAQVGIWVD
jgi:hypothetical protein